MVLDGVLVFQFSMIFNVYYTVLPYYCLSFPYPTCRGSYGSDVKSSVAAAFRVHKQSAVWCICTYRTLTRTQDARLQHLIYWSETHKSSSNSSKKAQKKIGQWDWHVGTEMQSAGRPRSDANRSSISGFWKWYANNGKASKKPCQAQGERWGVPKKNKCYDGNPSFKDPTCSHLWFEEVYD